MCLCVYASMASLDLDPMFRRGLRLLHSRNRESVEQLKAIVDEAVRQRQGKTIPPMSKVSAVVVGLNAFVIKNVL